MNGPEDPTKASDAARLISEMIRRESKEERLISSSEILSRMVEQKLLAPGGTAAEEGALLLQKVVAAEEDICALDGEGGSPCYYSSLFMAEAYARILWHKQGGPLKLIAGVVRHNSAVYPRPVPLDYFAGHPFDLALDEVLNRVKQMSGLAEYKDIESTTTSASRVFLYSTLHLSPEYARSLAEWLDVGQPRNP